MTERELAENLEERDVVVCHKTAGEWRKKLGWYSVVTRKVTLLSKSHKTARLAWARAHLNASFAGVAMTDEKWFYADKWSNRLMYVKKGPIDWAWKECLTAWHLEMAFRVIGTACRQTIECGGGNNYRLAHDGHRKAMIAEGWVQPEWCK